MLIPMSRRTKSKRKRQTPRRDGPRSRAGQERLTEAQTQPDPELVALRERVAALEAEVAALRQERDACNAEVGRMQAAATAEVADRKSGPPLSHPAELYAGEAWGMVRELVAREAEDAGQRVPGRNACRRATVLTALLEASPPATQHAAMSAAMKKLFNGYRQPDAAFQRVVHRQPLPMEVRDGKHHHKLVATGQPEVRITLSSSSSDRRAGGALYTAFRKHFL